MECRRRGTWRPITTRLLLWLKKHSSTLEVLSHRVVAGIGKKAFPAAEVFLKSSMTKKVFLNSRFRDGVDWTGGCLQLFSDKSHMSMSVGAIVFNLQHITSLSLLEAWCRERIQPHKTVFKHLLVLFCCQQLQRNWVSQGWKRRIEDGAISRISILKVLQESIEFSSENVRIFLKMVWKVE